MRLIQVLKLKAVLLMLYFVVNFNLASADDELYKKFHQKDYKLKLERETLSYYNKSVLEFEHYRYKYNRTQFVTNMSLLFHVDVGNDIEIVVQAFKFVSNEYRIFPMHFQYNFCKSIKFNIAGIRSCISSCGHFACPFKKNVRYYLCNCRTDESRFPPFMPSGSYKILLEMEYKDQIIATFESYLTIYRPILPGKRSG